MSQGRTGPLVSDPGMEDLLYESDPVRRFVGLKLTGPLPDETTILNFRHLLDATIIEAPSSSGDSPQPDIRETPNLLHGGETVVWGDAGYQGVHKQE